MSVATEVARIQTARNEIRNTMVSWGASLGTDNLTELASKIALIPNNGSITATVMEGDTYTIPAGYHDGSGTVAGVAGGGNYTLQAKTVTPTKAQQSITPDAGSYGLSAVTVEPIPDAYQDVSAVTAGAADVLAGKVIIAADGTSTAGTMPNNGAIALTIDGMSETSVSISAGYTSGGTVTLTDSIEQALAAI